MGKIFFSPILLIYSAITLVVLIWIIYLIVSYLRKLNQDNA